MKLITHIEYHTVWGQDLYLRSGIREYPMKYAPGDIWTAEVDGLEEGQTFGYRYEVHEGGFCVRTEWLSHSVTVPECHADGPVAAGQDAAEVRDAVVERDVIEVRDAWSDVPEDLPLRSAPFAEGIFRKDGKGPINVMQLIGRGFQETLGGLEGRAFAGRFQDSGIDQVREDGIEVKFEFVPVRDFPADGVQLPIDGLQLFA